LPTHLVRSGCDVECDSKIIKFTVDELPNYRSFLEDSVD
jgi:hypothetical protein